MDDVAIIVTNPLVAEPAGVWRAFGAPYWPPDLGGHLYRPLIIAAFALDRMLDGAVWFHAANLLWHGAAAVAVAVLARRWADTTGGLVAGVLVAVHPVHVEAVANVVGRAGARRARAPPRVPADAAGGLLPQRALPGHVAARPPRSRDRAAT